MNNLLSIVLLSLIGLSLQQSTISSCFYDVYKPVFWCQETDITSMALCSALYTKLSAEGASIVCRGSCGGNWDEIDISYDSDILIVNISVEYYCFADLTCKSTDKTINGMTVSGATVQDSYFDISSDNATYYWQALENICSQATWFNPAS